MGLHSNIAACHRCPLRQRKCAGPCECSIDGRDIIDHARAADCPKGYHSGEPLPPNFIPETQPHWGPPLWERIHRRPLSYAGDAYAELAFLTGDVPAAFGCSGCLPEWAAILSEFPPDLSGAVAYARWAHATHDRINARLGKPAFAWADAVERWGYQAEWVRQ